MLLGFVTAALAGPLGSPVAGPGTGTLGATAVVAANGDADALFDPSAYGLRLDAMRGGVGLWGDVDRVALAGDTRGELLRGVQVGAGARGVAWTGRAWGVGGLVHGAWGREYTLVDGVRTEQVDRMLVNAAPVGVWGPPGGGASAWLGPELSLIGRQRPVAAGGGWEWPDPLHVGALVGGELVSDDLVGPGGRGALRARVGAQLRAGETWGLALWVGFAR